MTMYGALDFQADSCFLMASIGIIAWKRLNIHKSPKKIYGSLQVGTLESSMLSVLEALTTFVRHQCIPSATSNTFGEGYKIQLCV